MKKMNILLSLTLISLSNIWGQTDSEKKYFKEDYADTVKDQSVVILRNYEEYIFSKHNVNDFKVNVVLRTQYKLKDLHAVESFNTLSKTKGLKKIMITQIKPDGKVNEIYLNEDTSYNDEQPQYSVKLNEGTDKIAVENLEIGDIVDYRYEYTYTTTVYAYTYGNRHAGSVQYYNMRLKNYNIFRKLPMFTEFLQMKHPSLSTLYVVEVPKELDLLQKAINCNYKFTETSKNTTKVYRCNIGYNKAYKSEYFSYAYTNLPVLKYCIVNTANDKMQNLYAYQFMSENVSESDIADLGRAFYANKKFIPYYLYPVDVTKDTKGYAEVKLDKFFSSFIKTFAKDNTDKLDVLNKFHDYLTNNDDMNEWQFGKMSFAVLMARFCDKIKQPYKMMACLHRYDGKWDEVIHPSEITWGIYIDDDGNELFISSSESTSNIYEKEGSLIGTKVILFNTGAKLLPDAKTVDYPVVPYKDNKLQISSEIKFRNVKKNFDYHFINTYTHTGTQRGNIDDNIAYKFYPERLSTNARFRGLVSYNLYSDDIYKDTGDFLPEFRRIGSSYDQKYEKIDNDNFEEYLYSEYHFRKITLDSFRILSGEGYPDNNKSENSFKVEFNAENVIENTTNGLLVLKLGRLITEQMEISNFKNNERNTDIHFTNQKEIDWEITIELPDGYQPVNLTEFSQKFENSAGIFNTTAVQKGNQIVLKIEKIYTTNFLPKEKWGEVTTFLKQAVLFYEKRLILDKK